MIIFKRISDLRKHLDLQKAAKNLIGFVPTMGALHEGHLTLIKTAKQSTGLTVCSIFVNPTQFNDPKDFEKYPVTIEKDIELLIKNGCDVLFLPSVEEMYPDGFKTSETFALGTLENRLEGYYRPGHFQGVCVIVHKLLNAVQPDQLFMGQKDLQQCMVVQSLIKEKNHPTELIIVPTVRETDGLAMSSRNMRLPKEARDKAVILSQVLQNIIEHISDTDFEKLISEGKQKILDAGFSAIDYLEICIPETLEKAHTYSSQQHYAVLVAAFIEEVRLIDNMLA